MRIDITSFFFNTTIPDATATAAWGTSVGQSKKNGYKIKIENESIVNLLLGMNYKILSDVENLEFSKMSKNRELLYFSIFDKVFINGKQASNNFILLFVKEHSETHNGRLIISYPPYVSYDNGRVDNSVAIKEFETILGVRGGSWFVYDISVVNQDELHFKAIVVDLNKTMTYKSSAERGEIWKSLIEDRDPVDNNKYTYTSAFHYCTQIIYYGAPGTGKSHRVEQTIENLDKHFYERVTFHPEFDNASFVGGYKPIENPEKGKEGEIIYKFVPQAFAKIYTRAWKDTEGKDYYLAIEEINRGNCAEIFGEIFQLLDRDSNYDVTPSEEFRKYLVEEFGDENHEGIKRGLKLPPNLHIWATMNTSDQSLFPMDSAFKRRWQWEYCPICYDEKTEEDVENKSYEFLIDIQDGKKYRWIDFIKKINLDHIKPEQNLGADKCIGNYFIKPDEGNTITLKPFINKVIFYLWNDVFKDEQNKVFEDNTSYEDFFPINTAGKQKVKEMFTRIGLQPITDSDSANADATDDEQTENMAE